MANYWKGFSPWFSLPCVSLFTFILGVLLWPHPVAQAQPLGAYRDFSITTTSPDIMIPNNFTVNVGDTIRFWIYNEGPAPHNLHISGQGVEVESPRYAAGAGGIWEYTFTRAGVYALYCSVLGRREGIDPPHRAVGPMEGVIVVTEPGVTGDLSRYQTRIVNLTPIGEARVTGTAYLQPRADGQIAVRVEARGLTAGGTYLSGLYNRTSVNCRGGLIGSLAAPVQAEGATARILYTVPGPIENFFSTSIQEGTAAPGTVVACSDIAGLPAIAPPPAPAAPAAPPAPAALPRTGDPNPLNQALAVALAGGLTLALGTALRRKRRVI